LAAAVGPERVVEGVAEAIPFPDGEFAAITVADGFHWFDAARALPEMRRVLRPGGGLLLASTVPDWGGVPWGHEVGSLLSSMRTEHPFFDGTPWDQTLSEAPGWTAARQAQVTTTQTLAVGDYVRSMSWVAAMEPAQRDAMLERIEAAVGGPAEVPVHTFMWLSARD
ncbi:MAG: smtA, partial [Solirubrobacterales bacterium]|nr:smtA [Solirubrobacterales bacterium]